MLQHFTEEKESKGIIIQQEAPIYPKGSAQFHEEKEVTGKIQKTNFLLQERYAA